MINFTNCINLINSHHMLLAVQDLPFSFSHKLIKYRLKLYFPFPAVHRSVILGAIHIPTRGLDAGAGPTPGLTSADSDIT